MADVKKAVFCRHPADRGPRHDAKSRGPRDPKVQKEPRGLGWNRLRRTIQPLATVSIDTGIGGKNHVEGEPPLGTTPPESNQPTFANSTGSSSTSLLIPVPGVLPASRLMVVPLFPISNGAYITMPTEPFWNTTTKTAWITLVNTSELLIEINLLVWDPLRHSPGRADTYTSGAA